MGSELSKHNLKNDAENAEVIYSLFDDTPVWDSSISSGVKVRSRWLKTDAQIIVFIPYNRSLSKGIYMNVPFYLTPYMLRFHKSESPLLIYKRLVKIKENKSNHYKLDEFLDVYVLESKDIVDTLNKYTRKLFDTFPLNGASILKAYNNIPNIVKSQQQHLSDVFEVSEDGTVNYKANNVWELTSGKLICLTNDFLCLCNYTNPVTWKLDYLLLPPDDLYKVLPEEDDDQEKFNF